MKKQGKKKGNKDENKEVIPDDDMDSNIVSKSLIDESQKKEKEKEKPEEKENIGVSQSQTPSISGVDYKEKFTYGNILSELLGLIGFAINKGGTGENELETFWAYLLPELRDELDPYREEQVKVLNINISRIPDGLVYFDEVTNSYTEAGNPNTTSLDVKALINPMNRKITHDLMSKYMQTYQAKPSAVLKDAMKRAFVRDGMMPAIIKTMQSHDLLMQTKKRVEHGEFSLYHTEEGEDII